jgi:hypothetical protein
MHSILYRNKKRSYELVNFDNISIKGNNEKIRKKIFGLKVMVKIY